MTKVKIAIYDIQGRLIDVPVNQSMLAGTYETTWDGSKNPSGVYFYRLETASFSESKKMMLVK